MIDCNEIDRGNACAGCNFDSGGKGTCLTGDCGGVLHCNGAGGDPPASLAEITLDGANGDDFYDISLVDGYNLPLSMTPLTALERAARLDVPAI